MEHVFQNVHAMTQDIDSLDVCPSMYIHMSQNRNFSSISLLVLVDIIRLDNRLRIN